MRRIRQSTLIPRPSVSSSVLAAVLLLCVLSSALPTEAVLSPYSLMPCCRGMMTGAGGECHGDSCPLHPGALAKPPKPAQDDPACGAEHGHQAEVKASPATQAQLQHAHGYAQAEAEHDDSGGVALWNASQQASRQASVGAASLGRPCPSDCCATATGSFNGLRRPRHEVVLTEGHRPRPPTAQARPYTFSGVIKSASEMRRSHPPRAPPHTLASHAA